MRCPQPRMRGSASRSSPARPGVLRCPRAVGQEDDRRAVGDLAAILLADASLDDRICLVVGRKAAPAERPAARLRIRITPCVCEIDLGDPGQVRIVEPEAAFVFVTELAEDVRPREPHVAAFVPGPHCRSADVLRRLLARDVAHLLDADYRREPVAPGFEVRHRREQRKTAGGTGAFVTPGGHAGEVRMRCRKHRRRDDPGCRTVRRRNCRHGPPRRRAPRGAPAAGHRRRFPASRRRSRGLRGPSCARNPSAGRRARTPVPSSRRLLRSGGSWPRATARRGPPCRPDCVATARPCAGAPAT